MASANDGSGGGGGGGGQPRGRVIRIPLIRGGVPGQRITIRLGQPAGQQGIYSHFTFSQTLSVYTCVCVCVFICICI